MKKARFWKLARPDGWDFYTGETIDYRSNIGKTVKCPNYNKGRHLCSNAFIHASRTPDQCFIGADIPCSVYSVEGTPIKEDEDKCGFKSLRILKEYRPEDIIKWRYLEAVNPVNPFAIEPPEIGQGQIELIRRWANVRNSVGHGVVDRVVNSAVNSVVESVGNRVGNRVGDSVVDGVVDGVGNRIWVRVWNSFRDSVWAYVGHIFQPVVPEWEKGYPYQSAVDLWKQGLVPSYDGNVWRLHGGANAKILWEGKIKGRKR